MPVKTSRDKGAFPVGQTFRVRRTPWILFGLMACGDDGGSTVTDAAQTQTDAPDQQQCLPQGAVGAVYRRQPNPKLIAGTHTFTDAEVDTQILGPDLTWDEAASVWHLYYHSPHGTFANPGPTVIRHATSTNLSTWTFDDSPVAITPAPIGTEAFTHPSVSLDATAPANRRFVMAYASAGAIVVAASADGATFTQLGTLTASTVFPGFAGELADPEIVRARGMYHLWFGSSSSDGSNTLAAGIGYATSTDGVTWTPVAAPVTSLLRTASDPKSGGISPSVVYDAAHCRWEMWMSNDLPADVTAQTITGRKTAGLWYATSTNGMAWTLNFQGQRDLVWDSAQPGEGLGLIAGADVAQKGTGRYIVYPAADNDNVPSGSTVPTSGGDVAGVITLNLATRDAPP